MTKTRVIEGMMCAHCEANVKNALTKIDGVKDVEVSAKKGTAVVTVEDNTDDQILKTAVENSGYKVLNID